MRNEIKVSETYSDLYVKNIRSRAKSFQAKTGKTADAGDTNYTAYKDAIYAYNELMSCLPQFTNKLEACCACIENIAEAFSEYDKNLSTTLRLTEKYNGRWTTI